MAHYSLAFIGVTVGRVGTVGWQHVHVWKGFCHYAPGWSPIRELIEAAVAYQGA